MGMKLTKISYKWSKPFKGDLEVQALSVKYLPSIFKKKMSPNSWKKRYVKVIIVT